MTMSTNTYNFNELEPYIVGSYDVSDYFNFVIYTNHRPYLGDKIEVKGLIYKVTSMQDVTTDEEFEEGRSYSEIYLTRITKF